MPKGVRHDLQDKVQHGVQEGVRGLLRDQDGLAVQGAVLDDVREGLLRLRLRQEVSRRAEGILQAGPGQGLQKGESEI